MAAQNQYPMNFMQQQVPQQGGMGQPGMATSGHAPHGGMSEQQRLWQQMQEQGRTPQVSVSSLPRSLSLATSSGRCGCLGALSAVVGLAIVNRQSPLPTAA